MGLYDVHTDGSVPGKLKKFGLDYESLKAINPGLIYCSITGKSHDDCPVTDMRWLIKQATVPRDPTPSHQATPLCSKLKQD